MLLMTRATAVPMIEAMMAAGPRDGGHALGAEDSAEADDGVEAGEEEVQAPMLRRGGG